MKLIAEAHGYTKPKIKIIVNRKEVKIKYPLVVTGAFRDRLHAFAVYVGEQALKEPGFRTMRGLVGMDEDTHKMIAMLNWGDTNKLATFVKEA